MLGAKAMRIVESKAPSTQRTFGAYANAIRDIVESSEGYFLATTQGGQFYSKKNLDRCSYRIGGLCSVSAMAASEGCLLVCSGHRLLNFWIDDLPDEIITSSETDHVAEKWDEIIDGIEVRDGVFYLNESRHKQVFAYDPRVTEWVFRDRRLRKVENVKVCSNNRKVRIGRNHAVWAKEEGLCLYERGDDGMIRSIATFPFRATHLAVSGIWLFAYVPEAKAVLRFKFSKSQKQTIHN